MKRGINFKTLNTLFRVSFVVLCSRIGTQLTSKHPRAFIPSLSHCFTHYHVLIFKTYLHCINILGLLDSATCLGIWHYVKKETKRKKDILPLKSIIAFSECHLYNTRTPRKSISAPALGKIITSFRSRTLCYLSGCSNRTPYKNFTKSMESEM